MQVNGFFFFFGKQCSVSQLNVLRRPAHHTMVTHNPRSGVRGQAPKGLQSGGERLLFWIRRCGVVVHFGFVPCQFLCGSHRLSRGPWSCADGMVRTGTLHSDASAVRRAGYCMDLGTASTKQRRNC